MWIRTLGTNLHDREWAGDWLMLNSNDNPYGAILDTYRQVRAMRPQLRQSGLVQYFYFRGSANRRVAYVSRNDRKAIEAL
jgi:hypothetical protein